MSPIELEMSWRMQQWERLQQSPNWPNLNAQEIRDLDLYRGQNGIWRDKSRTEPVATNGVAVSIMNSAGNYGDEIEGDLMIYDYPKTARSGSQDLGEISSLKNAMILEIPIFVISEVSGGRRNVRLGWVTNCEDSASACLVTLDKEPTTHFNPLDDFSNEFVSKINRKLTETQVKRIERHPGFKFKSLALYQSTCAVTDVSVEKMLDAAHVIPVADGGPDDVRNSLLLTASVHRAFDAHFWAIEPDSLKIATRVTGPTLEQMKITRTSISHLLETPHVEALQHRWHSFEKATNGKILIAS